MIVYDPIYGQFEIPQYLRELALSPAVRRLSQVRLLNTPSPSIAALGDVRRYSHTLGVLNLCLSNPLGEFSSEERKALAASVLLHDIGTPPFAHLLEYQLNEREPGGWEHEGMIDKVMWDCHAPENRAHQIFAGRTSAVIDTLKRSGISVELVRAIVGREHPLAALLFGSIDFDNLDNVTRMAWGLGILDSAQATSTLAEAVAVNRDRQLILDERFSDLVIRWADLRRNVYQILLFDPQAIAAQAVLFRAIGLALDNDVLSRDEWSDTDEDLIECMRKNRVTKETISRDFYGRLPATVFIVQMNGTLQDLGFRDRRSAIELVEGVLQREFPSRAILSYVIVDRGTFEKRLSFLDSITCREWHTGTETRSVMFFGFIRRTEKVAVTRCRSAVAKFLDQMKVAQDRLMYCQAGTEREEHGQLTFDFSTT